MIGKTFLHYKLTEEIGRGGMGVVYKANDLKLHREVALKFLPPHIVADEEVRTRFRNEAIAAAALNHPNITTIHSIEEVSTETDQTQKEMFIVMEYVDGQELQNIVKKDQNRSLQTVLDYATQIAEGLKAAHDRGVIHRDVKSSNIMITTAGQVKIMDFGLARIGSGSDVTKQHSTLGTLAFMSPEQFSDPIGVDHRADIWSFGVLLFQMLAGFLPFQGDIDQALMYSILNRSPKKLSPQPQDDGNVFSALAKIVQKALQKSRENRHGSMQEILDALGAIVGPLSSGSKHSRLGSFKSKPTKPALFYGGLFAILILIFSGIWFFQEERRKNISSIAVLPLANLSSDSTQEYFSDGMTEHLITELARTERFKKIISFTSVRQYKKTKQPLTKIASALDVDAIIEGSVFQSGESVRISVKLIDGVTEHPLWVESYQGRKRDVLGLQGEITKAIVQEIELQLSPQTEARLSSAPVVNARAYEDYLKGRYHWNKRTEAAMLESIKYFERAIAADSTYAPAYAGLADANSTLADWLVLPPDEAFTKARQAAKKALEIDPDLASAHNSLAFIQFMYHWNWSEAEMSFKRAIRLNDGYATAHQWYAEYLTAMGRYDEALAEINRALELDPLSRIINAVRAIILFYSESYDLAVEQSLKTLEIDPDFYQAHLYLAWIAEKQGDFEKAEQSYATVLKTTGEAGSWSANPGTNYARAGKRDQALSYLAELQQQAQNRHVSPMALASIHAILGNADRAAALLKNAYEARETGIIYLKTFPLYDKLRANPGTAEILQKMGMTP